MISTNWKIGILLAITFASTGFTQCPTGSTIGVCNSYAFLECQLQFNRATLLSSDAYWHDPDLMRYGLENLYITRSASGLYGMCSSYSKFLQCLGGNITCMDPDKLSCIEGIRLSKSRDYLGVFEQLRYLCGGGLPIYLRNEDCITDVFKNANSTFVACRNRWRQYLSLDPANSCYLAQDFIYSCYQSTFSAACGPEAGWFGCEYARTEVIFVHRQCPLSCIMNPASTG
uniref:Uncharacterized protein n=1 Tax=Plectus sambesii TaxID=2011161 RepID=A0A914X8H8_9BILA